MWKLGALHSDPPPSVQRLAARAALRRMSVPPRADWFRACPPDGDDLGNRAIGCCVPAADFREIQVRRANAMGDTWVPPRDAVLDRYKRIGGYDPSDPRTDIGTDTAADMADRCTHGIWVNSQDLDVVHWTTVNPLNDSDIALAISHFGSLLVTLALPLALQDLSLWSQAPGTGADWIPGSWGVHRVMVGAYDGVERVCRTWGVDLTLHPASWAKYCLAADCTISRMWLQATGLAPSGLDWEGLQADMADIATT